MLDKKSNALAKIDCSPQQAKQVLLYDYGYIFPREIVFRL